MPGRELRKQLHCFQILKNLMIQMQEAIYYVTKDTRVLPKQEQAL